MNHKAQQAIDRDKMSEEYGECVYEMVSQFEETFDSRIGIMLQGMIEKDWSKAILEAGTLKSSSGYLFANPFYDACSNFRKTVMQYATRIKYEHNNTDFKRIQYVLSEMFDDEKQLIAYELFAILMKEAIRLKIAMSEVTNSILPPKLYQIEMLQIQAIQEEIKRKIINFNNDTQKSNNNQLSNTQLLIEQPQTDTNCCTGCNVF